jgi:aryl-alcohol dehydrogenase-like predicted oxidoreductase
MDYTILGRTGLRVTVMGIGCGGPSRLGQRSEKTEAESIAVIREALDLGINFIDTAEAYSTEQIVGKAIKAVDRGSIVLSTKKGAQKGSTQKDVQKSLEESLKRLGTDYVDIYSLHMVVLQDYDYLVSEIVPILQKIREQGKIRFIGITERFAYDPQHTMLQRALQDDIWDVMMVGFNMLNQSARDRVFKKTIEKNIGILIMYAVGLAFSRPEQLRQLIEELIEKRQINPSNIDKNDPLGFLIHESGAVSLTDAAYRFCRYEPGTHVILSGTGNPDHLKANIESFSRPALPQEDPTKLKNIFYKVDSVSGE